MADWWEDQPLAGKNPSSEGGNWWESAPILGEDKKPKPAAALSTPEEPLGPFGAGWKGMGSDLRTAGAAVAESVGSPETARALLDEANRSREEVARRYKPKVPSYTDIPGEGVLDTLGNLGQYIYERGAESLPQMGATAAGGLGAMALAPAAVPAAVAGVAGGTLASLPFFAGQNIEEQLKEGKSLQDTSLATAAGAGVVQGALDTLVGHVLPGVGKAVAGGVILRAAKKGIEGGLIEGATEGLQQAIQIGQANPERLWAMSPEVQKEIAEAAVAGGLLGTSIGGASGAAQGRVTGLRGQDSSSQEVKPEEAIPPPSTYTPVGTGLPVTGELGLESGTGLPDYSGEFKKVEGPIDWFADKTGLPQTYAEDRSVLVPEATASPDADFEPMGTGLPIPRRPRPLEAPGISSGTGLPETGPLRLDKTGQKVFEDVQQKLLAAGRNPIEANAMARIWRNTYENFARKVGVDAYSIYKSANVDVRGPKSAQQVAEQAGRVLNQDPLETPQAAHYSLLQSTLRGAQPQTLTGQQWLNRLKKAGVKDEELVWTGVMDGLDKFKNEKLTKDTLEYWFKNAAPAVYEAKPDVTKPNHYGEWTLGEYGKNPDSNYREVVLGLENLPEGTYKSPHFGMVPNAVAHYRTTDRSTPEGKKVLLAEEFQSDWHQKGRKRGYGVTNLEYLDKINEELKAAEESGDRVRRAQVMAEWNEAYKDFKENPHGVMPDAPFKDSWPNLTFRHALFDAINSGKNYIAWPTGEQQADRFYDRENPSYAHKLHGMQTFYDKRIVDYANKLGKAYGAKVEKINVNDSFATEPEVWALPITPMMRELIGMGGLPLFQRKQGTPQGNITILNDRQIIRLFKTANESTFLHESMHSFLEQMVRLAPASREIAQDLQTLRDYVGNRGGSFTRDQHEKIARTWEQYFRNGRAPSNALKDIFKQFAEWLKRIYTRATDLGVTVSPEVQGVFDRLIATPERGQMMQRENDLRQRSSPNETYSQGSMERAKSLNRQAKYYDDMADKQAAQARRLYAEGNTRGAEMSANQATSFRDMAKRARGERSESMTFEQSPIENKDSNYGVLQRAARKTKAFFDPFSEVPQEATYRDIRNLMVGGVYQAEQSAYKAKKLFDKLSIPEKNVVNTYFETPNADVMTLPGSIRAETVALKKYINGPLKQALIENNLLPATAIKTNDDSYLPRLYLKHLLSEDAGVSGSARLNRAYSKKRNNNKQPDELIAMGEVQDPGTKAFYALFRTQRDLAVLDFLDRVAANGDWALKESLVPWNGKRVTPYWLKEEADAIEETRVHSEPDPARKALMRQEAARMRQAAQDGLATLDKTDYDSKLYKKIPDTADFGPLRGMIVRRQIADDIIGTNNFVDPDNTIDKWFGDRNSVLTRAVSHWKALKVPMNLPSQVRNIASNMILLNLSGVPIHRIGSTMYRAAREMLNDGPYYQIAKKYGVGKGTFSEQELFAINDELKRLDLKQLNGFMGWRKIARAMLNIEKKASDIHGKMEEWGKVAKIIDAMERQGLPENEAVREANKWLFDYSEAVPSVKRIRQMPLGMPFITFQYKMLPLMYEIIKSHPTRLLPYIALAYTIPALVAAGNGIDQDDAEKLRKALSSNLRRKNDMYLLPFKDDAGRWQFVDIGYFMPWQMPVDFARYSGQAAYKAVTGQGREATKDAAEAFRATSLLSNPVLNVASALTTGIDPFTDRPIADKRDPMQKQVADIVAYAWSLTAPSLLASYGALGQLISKEQGTGTNKYGEPQTTYGQIAARTMGVNTYPIVPDAQRARNIQYMQREIQDIKARMTNSLRDQSLTAEQRRRVAENFRDELMDRTKELSKYVRESQPSENLRRATARP